MRNAREAPTLLVRARDLEGIAAACAVARYRMRTGRVARSGWRLRIHRAGNRRESGGGGPLLRQGAQRRRDRRAGLSAILEDRIAGGSDGIPRRGTFPRGLLSGADARGGPSAPAGRIVDYRNSES